MINIEELSIGDWVLNGQNRPVVVYGLTTGNGHHIDVYDPELKHAKVVSENDIRPIPITHMFLVANGWLQDKPEDVDCDYYWTCTTDGQLASVIIKPYITGLSEPIHKMKITRSIDLSELGEEYETTDDTGQSWYITSTPLIRFVHHFQHQLRMIGIKKDIKVTRELIFGYCDEH